MPKKLTYDTCDIYFINMQKKIFWIVIILAIIAVVIGVNYRSDVEDDFIVKIGVLSPLTGSFASFGEDFSTGVRIAADGQNHNIEIVEEDTASDPKAAISAMNKLIAEGVTIFVGGPSSSVNLALIPIAEQNKVIFIGQSKTTKMDDAGEYIFRIFPLVDEEARMMADYIISKKSIDEAAIIFDSSSDTTIMARDIFKKSFEDIGGKITIVEGFDSKSVKDYRTMLLKVKSGNPKAIYLAVTENPSGPLLKQIKDMGIAAPIFGWSVLDTERLLKTGGTATEGLVMTAESFTCDRDSLTKTYCTMYAQKAGDTIPQYIGAYAHDTIDLLADLVEKHDGDFEKIRTGLSNIQGRKGVVGDITIDAKGNIQKSDFIFKTFKNGEIVKLEE